MAIKMKGIFKGIRYIFGSVQKEHEMEIGHPKDVKHIAHVGFDNTHGPSPSWMNAYKTLQDFSSGSLSNFDFTENSWASLDFEQRGLQPATDTGILTEEHPCPDLPRAPKSSKARKKKAKSPSSTRSSTASIDSYSTATEDAPDKLGGAFRIYVN